MGVSRDLKYKSDDLLEQPRLVAKYIEQLDAERVLELATGKGASSVYLAERFPEVEFVGIDLPNGQLDVAKRAARRILNFSPIEGDYHDLGRFPDGHFDVVFVIEALCHSTSKDKVTEEVWRVLRDGGVFVVFDGYLRKPESVLSANERLAMKLTERGMMVNGFEDYKVVKEKILRAGFKVIYEEDVSDFVVPTMRRFEKVARRLVFNRPKFCRFIARLLPDELTFNAISGFLMPLLVELGVARYTILVIEKQS